jgi:hypothetical protein
MADLLTHVLVPFVLLMIAAWRFDRITAPWIAIAMAGAAIPDLVKLHLLVKAFVIEETFGIPFNYEALSTLGGVALVAAAITVAFERQHWRRTYAYLVFGVLTALVLDGLRAFADGHASAWLFPLTWWQTPTPSLYTTSDFRVIVLVVGCTLLVAGASHAQARIDH